MRTLFKNFFAMIFTAIFVFNFTATFAQDNPPPGKDYAWYWLASDNKYSKFYAPNTVVVRKQALIGKKEVPTEIEAWTKTTYTYNGAKDTIKAYGIANILPDPKTLSYSLALLTINPQNRTIKYAREDFYDAAGNVIWSQNDGHVKEINSQAFDEDFFVAIVDEVFYQGEVERKNAEDRWIELWSTNNTDGSMVTLTADTTTMQMKGANLILWEWQETKNISGQVAEIRFMKKAVNLSQGTERIITGQIWNINTRHWAALDDEYGGSYHMIRSNEPDYKGLVRLRAFAKKNSAWVNRYTMS